MIICIDWKMLLNCNMEKGENTTRVSNTRPLIAMWIKNSVLAHESYIYPYSDMYKDIGNHEIDKVIASMELEYMDLVEKEELESCLSVDQLIEKYFG